MVAGQQSDITIINFDELEHQINLAYGASKQALERQLNSAKADLKKELQNSLVILSTTSPDKRQKFRSLFTSLPPLGTQTPGVAGVDFSFTDIGTFGDVVGGTAEKTGSYSGNLREKLILQARTLATQEAGIRSALLPTQRINPDKCKIVGMTEDSGWQLDFHGNRTDQDAFIRAVMGVIERENLIRYEDRGWLFDKMLKTENEGFPGPNLKPLQEHLGGFNRLMEVIYKAQEMLGKAGPKMLRYTNTSTVSFVVPGQNKAFIKTSTAHGKLLNKDEYVKRRKEFESANLYDESSASHREASSVIGADFVQIPDIAENVPGERTISEMEDVFTHSSTQVPAEIPRRKLTEWLQGIIGPRKIDDQETAVKITPAWKKAGEFFKSGFHNIETNPFDFADVAILQGESGKHPNNEKLYDDVNLRLALYALELTVIKPEYMTKPIILDNRNRAFNRVIELIRETFFSGRSLGDLPFLIANDDGEMSTHMANIERFTKLSPQRKPVARTAEEAPDLHEIPNDGVFTVFIGGGHNNNSRIDRENASDLGYMCAKNGWRIVTGAGSVHGSMGSVHTGFLRYHLNNISRFNGEGIEGLVLAMRRALQEAAERNPGANAKEILRNSKLIKDPGVAHCINLIEESDTAATAIEHLNKKLERLVACKAILAAYDYNVDLILEGDKHTKANPKVINDLADLGFIPKTMFFGYSVKTLLKLESVDEQPPPGITYSESGTLLNRLHYLMKPGTKIIMPGSLGTDEEFAEAIAQQIAMQKMPENMIFDDSTPKKESRIIVYNDGRYNLLLQHYGLLDSDHNVTSKAKSNRIVIVSNYAELSRALEDRGKEWPNIHLSDAQGMKVKETPVKPALSS